MIKSVKITIK